VPSQAGAGGGVWSSTRAPVIKVGGRVLLCSLADLPRDLSARVPRPSGTVEAEFVIVDESDAPPVDNNPAPTRSNGAAPGPGEIEDTPISQCSTFVSLGRRGQHVLLHGVLPGPPHSQTRDLRRGRQCGHGRGTRTNVTVFR
jgi:hypothetical protein